MIRARDAGLQVEGDTHFVAGVSGPQRLGCQAMSEQLVMDYVELRARADQAGGVLAGAVAEVRHHPGLVEGQPVSHAVPEPGFHGGGVVGERVRSSPHPPSALILEALGEIPVEQGEERLYARFQQPVHQLVVEVQPGLVDGTPTLRYHPGPRYREAVGRQPQVLHDPDVVAPSVVVIAGPPRPCRR